MKTPIPTHWVRNTLGFLAILAVGSFAGAIQATAAVAISEQSGAPTPGTYDVSQMSMSGDTSNPNSKNYYSNDNSSSKAVPPGQKILTPSGSPSYQLTDLYVQTGNGSGNGISSSSPWTLYLYSVSGSSATLVASYSGLTTGVTFNNGDWMHFSGLTLTLSANSTYAYAISTGGSSSGPYTGFENTSTALTGGSAVLIATNLSSGLSSVTTVSGFNGVFDAVLTPGVVALADNGSTAPTPGAADLSQFSTSGNTGNPSPIGNYYSNGNSSGTTVGPGEKITTGSNPAGYTLTDVYLRAGNGNGNGIGSYTPYVLSLYSVSGSTATLLTNYTGLVTGSALNNTTPGDWLHFSAVSVLLKPSQTYAFTVATPTGLLGGNGPYTGIENSTASLTGASAVVVNNGSGAITAATGANAVFDLGLTANSGPGIPTGLAATPGNNQVTLTWTAPAGIVTGYNVYRSTTSGADFAVLPAGGNVSGSPFTDTTAVNGTTYYYAVTALNGALEGSFSSQASTTPPRTNTAVVWNGVQVADNNWTSGTTDNNWLGTGTTFFENGDPAGFNDDASTGAQSVTLNSVVIPVSLVFATTNVSYTIAGSGAISGNTGLTNSGPGTVTLSESGGDNFSGGVNVKGGTLVLDNAGSAITGGDNVASNATLQVGNSDGNGSVPVGTVTNNGTLLFNRTDTGLVVGNTIVGTGNLIQAGGGSMLLSGNNTFSGAVLVTNNSTLQISSLTALGTTAGGTIVANGSTLDLDYGGSLAEPISVQGTGVGGNGAIINSLSASDPTLSALTMTGNTTLGGVQRWDCAKIGTGGNPYNLTITGSAYHEFSNASIDTNLANITLTGSATLGDKGTTALGNPTNTLEVQSGATLEFYNNGSANATLNKAVLLDNGGIIQNGGGASTIVSPITLGPGYGIFNLGGISLTINGSLNGSGVLYMSTGNSTLTVNGNSPLFSGGALVYAGQLVINGNFGSGSVTCINGTGVSGTGTVGGLVDVFGALSPGNGNTAGTFTAAGGLTLESSATLTNGLSTTIHGNNDLIAVTGNLNVNNNTMVLNQLGATLQNGIYPLITYTGTLNGSFAGIQTASPSIYTLTLTNITTTSPNEIAVIVSGTASSLLWNNGSGDNQWDVLGSFNWTNSSDLAEEQFVSADTVTLDDSITNAAVSGTNITIAAGEIVLPAMITNNSTVNYTITGPGWIGGGAGIVKLGTGTLALDSTNTFTGNVSIAGGTLQAWGPGGLGATNGTVTVTNGGTMDRGWSGVGPIVVSGAGVGGNGAIVNNSSGNAIYDGSGGGLTASLTLTGNTTFGGNTRWDLGYPCALSTGGSNYNLTINEANGVYMEWEGVVIDTNLGNIDIYTPGGSLGIKGSGQSLGNPANTITIHTNSTLTIWGFGTNDSGYAKNVHVMSGGAINFRPQNPNIYYNTSLSFDDGSAWTMVNGSGSIGTVLLQPIQLNGLVHLQVGDSTCTVSNVISGVGGFYWDNYNNTLAFTAANTYQGITDIRSGRTLALVGNGSISDSAEISLASGAALVATNRVDGTLTLAGGQTLLGGGSVNGFLTAATGSIVAPGPTNTTGTLTISSNATLNGNILLKLNYPTNDVMSANGTVNYGGTLTLTNLSATPLAAGDSFHVFNAANYSGAFSTILPATPGAGLAWNTNNLAVNGTLSVVSAVSTPPQITGITVAGATLTITATNGAAGGQFVLLGTTNLTLPVLQWTPLLTNNFSGSGSLNLSTNIINPATPQEFYLLMEP